MNPRRPVRVKSAVPSDWSARQEYPNDRTHRPARAASPVGHERSFTQQRYTYSGLPHRDSSNAHPAALKMGEK
jgi:hypothetical protein